jgi:EAL and modified HD-GYP domain-containing signal transduction protein
MQQVFIGRQPILDIDGQLYGYELLCRDQEGNIAIAGQGDLESTRLLVDSIFNIGVERLAKSTRAFINVTRSLLLNDLLDALPSDNIVLEVLETADVDTAFLDRLSKLRGKGFTIALDDFVLCEERLGLLGVADIVKLDIRSLDDAALKRHADTMKRANLTLLAEKVETREEYAKVRALGFDLFQGYYFARPELYAARSLRPSRLALLELIARISEPDVSISELAQLIRNDVAMSVAVLRSANAAVTGLKSRVESIDRAVVTLGLRTIQNWAGLIALARLNSHTTELLTVVLVRARACELLGAAVGRQNPAAYFTVGLFSLLDVMMETPMDELLEKLPLSEDIKIALNGRNGDLGAALKCVIAMELGDTAGVPFGRLEFARTSVCYQQAIEWADELAMLAT